MLPKRGRPCIKCKHTRCGNLSPSYLSNRYCCFLLVHLAILCHFKDACWYFAQQIYLIWSATGQSYISDQNIAAIYAAEWHKTHITPNIKLSMLASWLHPEARQYQQTHFPVTSFRGQFPSKKLTQHKKTGLTAAIKIPFSPVSCCSLRLQQPLMSKEFSPEKLLAVPESTPAVQAEEQIPLRRQVQFYIILL